MNEFKDIIYDQFGSQKEFASQMKVSPAVVSLWIAKRCFPSPAHICKMRDISKGKITPDLLYEIWFDK